MRRSTFNKKLVLLPSLIPSIQTEMNLPQDDKHLLYHFFVLKYSLVKGTHQQCMPWKINYERNLLEKEPVAMMQRVKEEISIETVAIVTKVL